MEAAQMDELEAAQRAELPDKLYEKVQTCTFTFQGENPETRIDVIDGLLTIEFDLDCDSDTCTLKYDHPKVPTDVHYTDFHLDMRRGVVVLNATDGQHDNEVPLDKELYDAFQYAESLRNENPQFA